MILPIATPLIDGVAVRFFKSPEAGLHLPWHAIDDLYRAMLMPRGVRRRMLERSRPLAGSFLKTVATPDGPVVIGAHLVAQGMIAAAIAVGKIPVRFEMAYRLAAVEAMNALTAGLSDEDAMQYTFDALAEGPNR